MTNSFYLNVPAYSRLGHDQTRYKKIQEFKTWITENVPNFFDFFNLETTDKTVFLSSKAHLYKPGTYTKNKIKQWSCNKLHTVFVQELINLIKADAEVSKQKEKEKTDRQDFFLILDGILQNHPNITYSRNNTTNRIIQLASGNCRLILYSDGSGTPEVYISSFDNRISIEKLEIIFKNATEDAAFLEAAKADILANGFFGKK